MKDSPDTPSESATGEGRKQSDPADDPAEDLERARRLIDELEPGRPVIALLATVDAELHPHITWMHVSRVSGPDLELLTITSPDSDKVDNIRRHAHVEWLLTSGNRLEQLYLRGEAEVVDRVAEIRRLWAMIGGKERAFFMKYYNSGLGFAILRTRITSATLVLPERMLKRVIPLAELT